MEIINTLTRVGAPWQILRKGLLLPEVRCLAQLPCAPIPAGCLVLGSRRSMLQTLPQRSDYVLLLSAEDVPVELIAQTLPACICCIVTSWSVEQCYRALQPLFLQEQIIADNCAQLTDCMLKDGTLEELNWQAQRLLGNPVVYGTGYGIVCFRPKKPVPKVAEPLQSLLRQDSLEWFFTGVPNLDIEDIQALLVEKQGVVLHNPELKLSAYVVLVRKDSITFGWLLCFGANRTLTDADQQVMRHLAELYAGIIVGLPDFAGNRDIQQATVLLHLLTSGSPPVHLSTYEPKLHGSFQLLAIQSTSGHATQLYRLQAVLQPELTEHYCCITDNYLVILLNLHPDEPIPQSLRGRLNSIGTELRVGVSARSAYLDDAPQLFWEAKQALAVSGAPVVSFRERMPQILLHNLSDSSRLQQFILPELRTLSTEQLQTLYWYLRCDGRHQDTAEKLKIHRNTLVPRLKRIQNLLPEPLTDGAYQFRLMLSLEILCDCGLLPL